MDDHVEDPQERNGQRRWWSSGSIFLIGVLYIESNRIERFNIGDNMGEVKGIWERWIYRVVGEVDAMNDIGKAGVGGGQNAANDGGVDEQKTRRGVSDTM